MPETQLNPPIKVRYESLPRDPSIKWPLVKVHLSFESMSLPQLVIALVDSGANVSILHPEIAEILGFKKRSLPFIKGGKSVSGDYESALLPKDINLSIYGYNFGLRFTVINNPHLIFPCILGENAIFRWARLDFQAYKGFFEIKFRKDIH